MLPCLKAIRGSAPPTPELGFCCQRVGHEVKRKKKKGLAVQDPLFFIRLSVRRGSKRMPSDTNLGSVRSDGKASYVRPSVDPEP